ncbi:hypothetical protein CU098_004009 [Rhizopus stolonifer]|uniref:UspA domain-containing protein n=1 Tax=Rhizopus stolonifer TaxID=4846 RepID=A0A367IIN6_RHIST|nr:hypothetical protein CU098_004009 [Rhizopus stolonifer]
MDTENRNITFAEEDDSLGRRKSINFESSGYRRRVSFDNTHDTQITHLFTLNHASHNFTSTPRSRTFLIALDLDDGSMDPIKFTLQGLVDEGDEIVVVGSSQVKTPISPKTKAEQVMGWIKLMNVGNVMISVIIEIFYNRPNHALDSMIKMYLPSAVIVGAKNKQKYKNHYAGTGIFKYRLQHTKTPIIIVKDQGTGRLRSASTGDISEQPTMSESSEVKDLTQKVKRSFNFFT